MKEIASYNVIARKYRPQTFSEVVGQDHVVRTLKNAIATHTVAHAYLFSGPRGVGKTTLARILAKALNCQHEEIENRPCNACKSCKSVVLGNSYLYQEIDGASHRGIDGMREIKDELSYAASQKQWRIFVIDEVHMLTTEAFNAMLKSLEEPPPRVVFIFCTTESHRIPITVRSRTQHFQFRLMDFEALQEILAKIVKLENIPCSSEALFILAKKASGSIRDAENLLEQVAAFARSKLVEKKAITRDDVLRSLSLTSTEEVHRFVKNLYEDELKMNHSLLRNFLRDGMRLEDFFYQLAEFLTELMSFKLGVTDSVALGVSLEDIKVISSFEPLFTQEQLHTLTDIVFDYIVELRANSNQSLIKDFFLHKIHRYKTIITSENLRQELLFLSRSVDKPLAQVKKSDSPQSSSLGLGKSNKGKSETEMQTRQELQAAAAQSDGAQRLEKIVKIEKTKAEELLQMKKNIFPSGDVAEV